MTALLILVVSRDFSVHEHILLGYAAVTALRHRLRFAAELARPALPTTSVARDWRLTSQPTDVTELANTQALAVSRDVSGFFPRSEHAADRIQRRAAHFGDILPGEGKLDDGIVSTLGGPSVR
jgi:hypothetical protein